jgi:hypothetical protein
MVISLDYSKEMPTLHLIMTFNYAHLLNYSLLRITLAACLPERVAPSILSI